MAARLTEAERLERAARRAALPTEAQLQAQIVELAGTLGYLAWHPWLSIRSEAGFPDLVLCRPARTPEWTPGRVVFAEIKVKGRKLTAAQERWRDALLSAGQEWFEWRDTTPMQEIAEVLAR